MTQNKLNGFVMNCPDVDRFAVSFAKNYSTILDMAHVLKKYLKSGKNDVKIYFSDAAGRTGK